MQASELYDIPHEILDGAHIATREHYDEVFIFLIYFLSYYCLRSVLFLSRY